MDETAEINQAAETVAGEIAAIAGEIIEKNNEETTQAEAVNEALTAAVIDDIRIREMRASEDRIAGMIGAQSSALDRLDERVSRCETTLASLMDRAATAEALAAASILTKSPPPNLESEVEAVPEKMAEPLLVEAEAIKNPEPPPPESKKKKRRLL